MPLQWSCIVKRLLYLILLIPILLFSQTSNVVGDFSITGDFDDQIRLTDGGKVYQNEWIPVDAIRVPTLNPAIATERGISIAWEFTDGADDVIFGTIRIPQDMDRTVAPEFKIGWSSDTADPGDDSKQAYWQLEYLFRIVGESMTTSAQDTLTTITSSSTTTTGLTISTITGIDLPEATAQLMAFRLTRLGSEASDTLGDDVYMHGCGLKYIKDKLGVEVN